MLARAHKNGRLATMTDSEPTERAGHARREPPRFRHLVVRALVPVSPRLLRITFGGPDLEGFTVDEPAASVRLLLPASASDPLVIPTWNGNEFLLPDGSRPTIRTFTPRRVDTAGGVLDLEAVIHGRGVASEWAARVEPGAAAAISGPGRGYTIDPDAPAFLLAGDETAIPAISQLLEVLPTGTPTQVHIEVARLDARLMLPEHPRATIAWYDLAPGAPPGAALVAAVRDAELVPGARVWVAGEAAGVQRIRRHLFEERAKPRAEATVRGYWKHGRAAGGDEK
jgi:NADPH-dependent ferric siderophore reductase